jgi:hypothetical protein
MELAVVGVIAGAYAAIYWMGRWILGPIDRAAKAVRAPVRFSIADFLCLFVAVQLPLTLAARLRSKETEIYFWLFSFLAWAVAPVIWGFCALALSRAGVTSGKHRLVFMGLVLPVVYYGLIPFVILAAIAISMLSIGDGLELLQHQWLAAAWVCTGIALVSCGIFTNRLTAQIGWDTVESGNGPSPAITQAFQSVSQDTTNHIGTMMPPGGNRSASGH